MKTSHVSILEENLTLTEESLYESNTQPPTPQKLFSKNFIKETRLECSRRLILEHEFSISKSLVGKS